MQPCRLFTRMCSFHGLIGLLILMLSNLIAVSPTAAAPSYGTTAIGVQEIETYGTFYYSPPSSTDYVADTLCNEWLCSWNDQALYAGTAIIRSIAFWELNRSPGYNCHGAYAPNGFYYHTQSAYYDSGTDQRYIYGSAPQRALAIVGSLPDWHINYNGDYVYSDYGSVIQNRTQDLANAGYDWMGIIHNIYDNRLTGSGCGPGQYLSPSVFISTF